MNLGVFNSVIIILFLVVAIIVLFRRHKLPSIFGYLFVGSLVGSHALDWLRDVKNITQLADFDVMFLMFTIKCNEKIAETILRKIFPKKMEKSKIKLAQVPFDHKNHVTLPENVYAVGLTIKELALEKNGVLLARSITTLLRVFISHRALDYKLGILYDFMGHKLILERLSNILLKGMIFNFRKNDEKCDFFCRVKSKRFVRSWG
ncbi:MAG: cation:proton antiporter [Gammaproteobacteria bacterium]|nr:cation:proton antiporter [Gammaproteobacteria bacterium]